LSKTAQERVKEAVWKLERLKSVSELMTLMKADDRASAAVEKARPRPSKLKQAKPALA